MTSQVIDFLEYVFIDEKSGMVNTIKDTDMYVIQSCDGPKRMMVTLLLFVEPPETTLVSSRPECPRASSSTLDKCENVDLISPFLNPNPNIYRRILILILNCALTLTLMNPNPKILDE